jgi:NADH:ubiquinone oxidoreductase subunit 6 (subunit J)
VFQLLFFVIATLGVLTALGTVLARNLVHAALFLVAFFFTIACHFVLLEAEFLAALQVLVYIGAVAILLMFAIMLTRNIQGDDTTIMPGAWKLPALFAGLCVFAVLVFGINNAIAPAGQSTWSQLDSRPGFASAPPPDEPAASRERRAAINSMAKVIGNELMTRYVVGFEVAGLLLTAALVGAIALAHREEEEPGELKGGDRPSRQSVAPGPGPAGRPLETTAASSTG